MTRQVEDIWQAIKTGRDDRIDWFGEQTSPATLASTLAAMANSQGGMILIGVVGPTTTPIGVRDADSVIDRVLQAALSIEPSLIIPLPRVVLLKGQPVVIVDVPAGMPHIYALDGRYLHRAGSENTQIKPEELRRLIIRRSDTHFESEAAAGAELDDLDWSKIETYAANLGGIGTGGAQQTLLKRGCLVHEEGHLRPTHAGILLFGKDPQRFVRSSEITAARFAGDTMSDRFSRQDILGTLPDQIRRAETFLVDHLRKGVHIRHTMAREENFEYPLEAARELVVNAVAHRDYSITGDNIRLFIYRDRMEITSPGGLPGPVTIDNIKDERFSRNPVIVQVLSDMGFIERLGYGVDRVIDLMERQSLRAPEFSETAGGFRVALHNQIPEKSPTPLAEPVGVLELNGQYNGVEINPRQEAALSYLLHEGNPRITNSDLQILCPDVHPETIRRDLVDLVTKNILQKMGQKRGSYYILKRL